MKYPQVTVGIIAKNEEKHIGETINSILQSDYPPKNYEIVIVDGNSADKTQEIVKRLSKSNKNIRLIIEPWKKGTHGKARNLLVENARGKYIAFTDADCIVERNWLKVLVTNLEREKKENKQVVAVGGIRYPAKTQKWRENLLNNMMSTFFGSGGSKGFMKTTKKYVDSIPGYNSIFTKEVLQKERYDDEIGFGEDYEFNMRLNMKGYKLVFNNEVIIYHNQEDNFSKFFKQMYNYGKGQVQVYKKIRKIRFFAILSPLFILGIIIGFFLSLLSPIIMYLYLFILMLYLFIDLIFTLKVLAKVESVYGLLSFFIYPMQHISYGLGVLGGLIR